MSSSYYSHPRWLIKRTYPLGGHSYCLKRLAELRLILYLIISSCSRASFSRKTKVALLREDTAIYIESSPTHPFTSKIHLIKICHYSTWRDVRMMYHLLMSPVSKWIPTHNIRYIRSPSTMPTWIINSFLRRRIRLAIARGISTCSIPLLRASIMKAPQMETSQKYLLSMIPPLTSLQRCRGIYSIILMDINMPGIDGGETVKRLRKMYPLELSSCLIVAYTAIPRE